MKILGQWGGLVAIEKPAGLLVIPGRAPEDQECARDLLSEELGKRVWVCHRIDRDTSGIVLFALDAEAHRAASMAFENGEVKKRYLALVEGEVTAPLDLDQPLTEARKGKMRVLFPGEEGGKPARTLVTPRGPPLPISGAGRGEGRFTLVECEPLTGRQHQIRVHLKSAGHALLFDHQYGNKTPVTRNGVTLSRTPLHASRLVLESLGVAVESPLPEDLARFSSP